MVQIGKTVKIWALSSGNISTYEHLIGKGLLDTYAPIKTLEYSPLDSQLKKETDIVKKQSQRLDKLSEFDKKPTLIIYNKSYLISDANHMFQKHHDIIML